MFKTPLIKLASLGLLMVGAQASGGDGSCDTTGQPHNSGASMNIVMLENFLSAVSGATALQGDGSEYGLISCLSAACEVIAETQSGMVVGRSPIGGESGNVGLTVYGYNAGDAGLAADEEINFHLVDDTGTLFDIGLSSPISYTTNGLAPVSDTSPDLVLNCQPATGDSSTPDTTVSFTATLPAGTASARLHSDALGWDLNHADGVASDNGDGTWTATIPAPWGANANYKWVADGVEENLKDDVDAGYCANDGLNSGDWGANRVYSGSGDVTGAVFGECSDTPAPDTTVSFTATLPAGTASARLHSDALGWDLNHADGVASDNGDGTWTATIPAPWGANANYKWVADGVEENLKDDVDAGYCANDGLNSGDWGANRVYSGSGDVTGAVFGECSDTPAAADSGGTDPVDIQGCMTNTAFGYNPLATTPDDPTSCVTVEAPAGTAPAGTAVFALDTVNKNANWGQATAYADDNGVQVYNDFNYQGITFGALNVLGDASVHIDYNIHDLGGGTEVRLFLVSNGNEFGIALSNVGSGWQSDDIALSAFADGVDLTQVDQIKLALTDSAGATKEGGAVAVANIVFKAPADVDCTGSWGACKSDCSRDFTQTVAQSGNGAECPAEPAPACPPGDGACPAADVDCTGSWGACKSDCSRDFTQTVAQSGNGAECPAEPAPACPPGEGACPVDGCTDEEANNYNAAATQDDGTCDVPSGGNAKKKNQGKNKAKNKLIAAGLDGTLVDNIGDLAITDGKRGIGDIMREITAVGHEVRKSVIRAALAEGNEVSFDLADDANIPTSIKTELGAKSILKVVAKQGKTRNAAKKDALLGATNGGAICGGDDVDVYIEDVPAGEMVEVVFEAVGDVSIKCWDDTRPLSHMTLTSEDPPTAEVRCWDVDQWASVTEVNQDESYVCQGFTSYMLSDGIPADVDTDGDGVTDGFDAFPNNPSETADSDGDGVGDQSDAFPNDATETVDSDGDGTGDNADTDDDGDGVADAEDAFPNNPSETADSDNDGVGDNADTDDDNDGVADNDEAEGCSLLADCDDDGANDNADVNPNVASVQTCAEQEDYWLDAGCACGGGAGGENDPGSTAWCTAQKGLWTAAECDDQCSAP